MASSSKLAALNALFAELGAPDPKVRAHSQLKEGIPQLARFLFLRQAWRAIVPEDDPGWIDNAVADAKRRPNDPYAGAGHAITKLKAKGATNDELTDLVRAMQAELLFSFCQLLEDPGDVEDSVSEVMWALVQVDESGNVYNTLDGLHEDVLATDPTGREMRPRDGE